MTRLTTLSLVVLLVIVGAASAASSDQVRTSARSAVQVTGTEFRLNLSKRVVKPGSLRVEFVNFGEDDHDLAITRKGSSYTRTMRELMPKEREVQTFNVRRGSYIFWCTLSNHKSLGMRAVLKVR